MSLREQVVAGGTFLALRQGIGFILNLVGITLLTRIVGPTDYGLYVISLGAASFLTTFSTFGVNAYLVRSEDDLPIETYRQAFSFVLCVGTLSVGVTAMLISVIVPWLGDERLQTSLLIMLPATIFALSSLPATAMIERALQYRTIAVIELSGQVAYFLVALPLSLFDHGVYALVMGYWAQIATQFTLGYKFTHIRPQLHVSRDLVASMTMYGSGVSFSSLIWQSRSLVIPLLVGRYAGLDAAAFVNLATRLVEAMTLLRRVVWRLAIVSFAKIQNDVSRLQSVLDEAMTLQVLATGPFLAGLGIVGPLILPMLLGPEWDPALELYPFVAITMLTNAVFSMQTAALQVRKQMGSVALFHAIHITILIVACVIFLPRSGLIGYAAAEILALTSYVALHCATHRYMKVTYRQTLPWVGACMCPLFVIFLPATLGTLLIIPSFVIILLPPQAKQIASYVRLIRQSVAPRFTHRAIA